MTHDDPPRPPRAAGAPTRRRFLGSLAAAGAAVTVAVAGTAAGEARAPTERLAGTGAAPRRRRKTVWIGHF
jgi:hypothetical protein